ncbi:type II toxin-antitoxin system RelE/ParE family toxin [Candidatus Cryosericum hinesii]|jgi:proteic killer suppression protein|uniref:Type II toxin-antitoxin system RelE/ParE family toxin n=1 Tax=Candidatus Cryosericum hinesii TaxID=2290915 RepID=A0A398DMF1_9BACT|nr:type II toxin-antitoxin system RelE/ParE family toxin [Candidatus Cryosericum hinesii]RIE13277.1 type II toxin-antitoxin system RelE/ParE family toxin [Candidatus Cryosericum hinesii]RIE15675.1 type II toxin-antitoxin system RelE/ParE family toxin [Candidatus Cryosericum hinesii]
MIKSFGDKETEKVWNKRFSSKLPPDIQQGALNKLRRINAASSWIDLDVPRGNGLEKLKGDRTGQISIHINDQWRICFYFKDGEATEVSITDYH